MKKNIRVRFAPSPTGALHIGGMRTALFNYLFAKKNKGSFIVRIEDTDQSRFVEKAETYIQESLDWCGISPDESPWKKGDYGPYRQSQRKEIYKKYAYQLIEAGFAYYAFDSEEELEEMREKMKAARVVSPQYNCFIRNSMKNSLTLSKEEVKARIESGSPFVIRLKVPQKEEIRFYDLVRGWIMVSSFIIDDKILLKSDGMPTYHLAHVIDDYLMKISHVIRGEEWLPSTSFHLLIYKYLNWEAPQFCHLPLLLNPEGKGKLSKRDGERLGFSVFPIVWQEKSKKPILGYREEGYLPHAFLNFLALLGWSPGNNREIFSLKELEDLFSIERIGKAGIKFDILKAKWLNQQHIKQLPDELLVKKLIEKIEEQKWHPCNQEKLEDICKLIKQRLSSINEIIPASRLFFIPPQEYDKELQEIYNIETEEVLKVFCEDMKTIEWEVGKIKEQLKTRATEKNMKMGKVMKPLRILITGLSSGADLIQIIHILGRAETLNRLDTAFKKVTAN